jgi:hypothetical protein
MKSVIKLFGMLIPNIFTSLKDKKLDEQVQQYLTICGEYSKAEQKDFLRIAVIKSFKISLAQLSKNIPTFSVLLKFANIVIRLLNDEIPEIRQKMSSLLTKVYKAENPKMATKFNPNYMLSLYFDHVVEQYFTITKNESAEDRVQLCNFILEFVFESEFDQFAQMAHFDKRIF